MSSVAVLTRERMARQIRTADSRNVGSHDAWMLGGAIRAAAAPVLAPKPAIGSLESASIGARCNRGT